MSILSQKEFSLFYVQLEYIKVKVKVTWYHYRPSMAQRVGSSIALLFHDHGTRRGWVVSSTPRPHFTPGKDLVPILQEAGWALGPVWRGGKSRPHQDLIPDHPVRSSVTITTELPGPQLLYLVCWNHLRYPAWDHSKKTCTRWKSTI